MSKFVSVLAFVLASLVLTTAGGSAAVPSDYKIRPNDTISVLVFGEEKLSANALRVPPSGVISLPLGGDVLVGGLSPAEASDSIARSLTRYLRYPKVSVSVVTLGTIDVSVLGNVKTPGRYTMQSSARLTDALAAAGGLGPTDGNFPMARIQRSDGSIAQISLQSLLHDGAAQLNVPMSNETTIYVASPSSMTVEIFGAVDHPGDIALREGDRLITAVARAGPSTSQNPDLNRVTVRRMLPNGQNVQQTFDLYAIMKSGDVAKDLVLQKGDVVMVPTAKKQINFNPLSILSRYVPFL
ncbi:MAG: polysaccharide biosynthesis/export family protein [Candidatus Eremiobacteraeota bacterium]|nr:polysaccharide biosynthesis/export family protein [Candidatus Eremiobacteraeota bacterium]